MKKTILITGSTDGIGKLAAIKLAKEGHVVYLHGRNQEKLNKTISEVKTISKNDTVFGYISDFSDFESVKKMANEIKNDLPKLDVLINNAGVFQSPVSKNKNGLDLRFVVNYLAPYLLTKKLLPLLEKATGSRIINLSSAAQDAFSMQALRGKEETPVREAYGQSKLALTMWSFDLAKKSRSTVIAVNPGSLLNTRMVKEAYGKFWSPAEKGGDILFDLSVSESYSDSNGKYFDNDKGSFSEAHTDAYVQEKISDLISVTESILSLN